MKPELASRRNFLKVSGALGAAGALTGCLNRFDPFALPEEKAPVPGSDSWYHGEERQIASACAQCQVNCGILVRVVEGRAVKINGNPASLLAGGKLGPKGQTGLFSLYDPDRIRGPLQRVGERGSGKWEEISWDQAIAQVSEKLGALRGKSGAHQLSVLCGRPRGFMPELLQRFCAAFGTPNYFDPNSLADGGLMEAMELMTGVRELPGYDSSHTSYILSLGSGIFESTCNGIHFARSKIEFTRDNPTRRSKIVQVDPTFSASAKVADDWIQINPGTYDVLALGIAHQLIKANLHDREFLAAHTVGFDGFAALLENYPIDKVSKITGISEKNIYELSWELAASKPSVVVVDSRSMSTSNGLEIARCALALNAVLGNLERKGGVVTRKDLPLSPWPEVKPDAVAAKGLAQPPIDGRGSHGTPFATSVANAFPESVLSGTPYPTEALLLYYSNPLFARNEPGRFEKAFAKIPFIVSFSPFMDESAHAADLILPDHTYLERWEEAMPPPFGFQAAIGIRRPVVEPLYNTRSSGDVLFEIAGKMGGSLADAFPWKSFRKAMEERLEGVQKSQRGSIVAEDIEDFLKKLTKVGYWNDTPSPEENWKAAFRTPSGKFEFHSQAAEEKIRKAAEAQGLDPESFLKKIGKPDLNTVCLPHAETPSFEGDPGQFPLVLFPYKDITYAEGSGANIPILKQLAGIQKGLMAVEAWQSWVELNSETAAELGLARGDLAWIESAQGKVQARVLTREKIPPHLVLMMLGKGHTQYGRFAEGKGVNPKLLVASRQDPLSGLTPNCVTRVRIAKA